MIRPVLFVSLSLAIACTEWPSISDVEPDPAEDVDTDVGAALGETDPTTLDTESFAEPDTESPADTESPCFDVTLAWSVPFQPAELAIAGEIRDASGHVAHGWATWDHVVGPRRVAHEVTWCDHASARWTGVAIDADGQPYAWSCMHQSATPGDFALIGTPTCTLRDARGTHELEVEITPAPTSEGCEVTCRW